MLWCVVEVLGWVGLGWTIAFVDDLLNYLGIWCLLFVWWFMCLLFCGVFGFGVC